MDTKGGAGLKADLLPRREGKLINGEWLRRDQDRKYWSSWGSIDRQTGVSMLARNDRG